MVRVCNLLWVEPEQHVAEWDKWVQKKLVRTGALEFRTVNNPPGPRREPVMVRKAALLDVAYADDDGTRGYVGQLRGRAFPSCPFLFTTYLTIPRPANWPCMCAWRGAHLPARY